MRSAEFILRTVCSVGHDLRVHGYSFNGQLVCKLCRGKEAKKKTELGKKPGRKSTFARLNP